MRTIGMSSQLYEFLKENEKDGVAFNFWSKKFQSEFENFKEKDPTLFKVFDSHGWRQCDNIYCLDSSVYSICSDVELKESKDYWYYVPIKREYAELCHNIYEIMIKDMTTPNCGIVKIPITWAPSFEGFAGYEHEKNPGEFLPNIDYTLGKVTRVRFI